MKKIMMLHLKMQKINISLHKINIDGLRKQSKGRDRQKCLSLKIFGKVVVSMRINFYDTRIEEDNSIMLVKEKGVNYGMESLDNAKCIVNMLNTVIELNKKAEEHIYLIGVNSKNKVVGVFLISKGTVNQCIVSPREIFIRLLLVGAVHFMVCHNHPSKDCTPSGYDIVFTRRLKEAGLLLNVPLADHIIIGGDWYYSFKDQENL